MGRDQETHNRASHSLAVKLQGAEEGDEEGDTEVDAEAVEEREDDVVLATTAGDDGQGGVHGGGATGRDGSEATEPPHHQRGSQQGNDLAQNVGQQCHGTQFGTFVLGNENA